MSVLNKITPNRNNAHVLVMWIIAILAFCISLYQGLNLGYSSDEFWTLVFMETPISEILSAHPSEKLHQRIYYFIVKIFSLNDTLSLVQLHTLNSLFYAGSIFLAFRIGKILSCNNLALIFAVLIASNPAIMAYSTILRVYIWNTFFFLLFLNLLLQICLKHQSKSHYKLLLFVLAIVIPLLHVFQLIYVLIAFGITVAWTWNSNRSESKNLIYLALSSLLINFAIYWPTYKLLKQEKHHLVSATWIKGFGTCLNKVFYYISSYETNTYEMFLVLITTILFTFSLVKKNRLVAIASVLLILIPTELLHFLAANIDQVPRYHIPLIIYIMLLLAFAINSINSAKIKYSVVTAFSLLIIINFSHQPFPVLKIKRFSSDQKNFVSAELQSNSKNKIIIYGGRALNSFLTAGKPNKKIKYLASVIKNPNFSCKGYIIIPHNLYRNDIDSHMAKVESKCDMQVIKKSTVRYGGKIIKLQEKSKGIAS